MRATNHPKSDMNDEHSMMSPHYLFISFPTHSNYMSLLVRNGHRYFFTISCPLKKCDHHGTVPSPDAGIFFHARYGFQPIHDVNPKQRVWFITLW